MKPLRCYGNVVCPCMHVCMIRDVIRETVAPSPYLPTIPIPCFLYTCAWREKQRPRVRPSATLYPQRRLSVCLSVHPSTQTRVDKQKANHSSIPDPLLLPPSLPGSSLNCFSSPTNQPTKHPPSTPYSPSLSSSLLLSFSETSLSI